jgi:flagellar biosynthesis protein FlhB
MALFDENEERTENASVYRREEFRRQGSVAMSREVLSVILLLFVGASIYAGSHSMYLEFSRLTVRFFDFSLAGAIDKKGLLDMGTGTIKSFGWMVLPAFSVAILAGIVACAAQVGFLVSWEPLTPKWERLDPIQGFGRIFSLQGTVEAIKAFFKLIIAGWVVWSFIKANAGNAGLFFQKSIPEINLLMFDLVSKLFLSLIFYLLFVAAMDYFYQRFRLEKQMKMTKRETKEEFKLREGDPLIKSRIRAIQRRIASRRMMDAVPKATVVVTNPTHIAIALEYDGTSMRAPKVTAKGAGFIADKIKEIARANNIPIVENKPLARTIFKSIDINKYIPRELYKAVAEVLAYVYKLKGLSTATA